MMKMERIIKINSNLYYIILCYVYILLFKFQIQVLFKLFEKYSQTYFSFLIQILIRLKFQILFQYDGKD